MTFCLCFAVPVNSINVASCFSKRISFETITRTLLGKAVLGRRLTGQAYLLSIEGHTEVLLDRGPRRLHASQVFLEGVTAIVKIVPSASFLVAWLNSRVWDDEYSAKGCTVIRLSDLRTTFPSMIVEDIRYVVDISG